MPYPLPNDDFDAIIHELVTGGPAKERAAGKILPFMDADDCSTVEGSFEALQLLLGATNRQTLVVNLFPGPGAGKTTVAHGLMNKLKWSGIRAEFAGEFAKDLVWEKRQATFEDQIYLFAKMYHRIFRLLGQVEVVVTDSPILLTPIYDLARRQSLIDLVLHEHSKMRTYNVFLNRTKKYDPIGRNQNEAEAKAIDIEIADFLDANDIPYEVFECYEGCEVGIVHKILTFLGK